MYMYCDFGDWKSKYFLCCYSLVALIPLCENMPSGAAIKPGDVVTAMNGKTIEVCGSKNMCICLFTNWVRLECPE